MPPQRPTQSDRRRLDQLTELASTDSGTSDGGPEPIVSPATAAAIRARSPWFDGNPSERDLSAWSPPTHPGIDADDDAKRRFRSVKTAYHDDLSAIYGDEFVTGLSIHELRLAREQVTPEDMEAAAAQIEIEAVDALYSASASDGLPGDGATQTNETQP